MPIETAPFVNTLNASNPPASDALAQADDHMRLIKAALLATFPALDAAVSCTPTELNQLHAGIRTLGLANGSKAVPSQYFDSDTDNGVYRPSANHYGIAGRLVANGAVPVGSLHHFPKLPAVGTYATGGSVSGLTLADVEFIENDGSTYNIADFPDLAAYLGTTFGGNGGTTFAVPNETDTGRFRRSRASGVLVSTYQSNVIKTHTHSVSGTALSNGDHSHTITIDEHGGHSHGYGSVAQGGPSGGGNLINGTGASNTTALALTGITASSNTTGAHTHTLSGTAAAEVAASTETRPESFVCFSCSKT